jgi:hypothetical protein
MRGFYRETMAMTKPRDDSDEVELHPQYDMTAQLDELYSIPLYRQPENPLIEVWREIGERLLALGERNLIQGVDEASEFLQAKLEARRRRRERRAAKRRAVREARVSQAASSPCSPAADPVLDRDLAPC